MFGTEQKNVHSFLFQHEIRFACTVFARGHIRFGIIKKKSNKLYTGEIVLILYAISNGGFF